MYWKNRSAAHCSMVLVAQCAELALAPDTLEVPVYASLCVVRCPNAVRLHRLADETAAVWRDLDPMVRARTIVHLHTQCGNGGYMPVWTDLFDPELPEDHGPVWTSRRRVGLYGRPADRVAWRDVDQSSVGRISIGRRFRFENHIVEAPENYNRRSSVSSHCVDPSAPNICHRGVPWLAHPASAPSSGHIVELSGPRRSLGTGHPSPSPSEVVPESAADFFAAHPVPPPSTALPSRQAVPGDLPPPVVAHGSAARCTGPATFFRD